MKTCSQRKCSAAEGFSVLPAISQREMSSGTSTTAPSHVVFLLCYVVFHVLCSLFKFDLKVYKSDIKTHSQSTNMLKKIVVSYLSQQTPSVFTEMWADGGQQKCLSFYELEDKVSVHALDGQLTILVFGCL